MRHITGAILFATYMLSATYVAQAAPRQGNLPDVRVYLDIDPSIGAPMMNRALLITHSMFHDIGVEVEWGSGRAKPQLQYVADSRPIEIDLGLVGESDGGHEGALAYAQPYGEGVRSITVLFDRIEPTVLAWPALGPTLLAHVMAHEIAHVLEGSDGHSASGVMKARWTKDDYWQMSLKPLTFSPADVTLMRERLVPRTLRGSGTT